MTFTSTKTYGHDIGLSCAFRQWKADSHCRYVHGYALSIRIEFEADELDDRNWVVDFGGLKSLKKELQDTFDHKTVISSDDPALEWFEKAHQLQILDLVVLDGVGCEKFAEYVFHISNGWIACNKLQSRCKVSKVEVKEHGANSAIFKP